MPQLISTTDFTGDNAIATDVYTDAGLELAIATLELELLYRMLGVGLTELFLDDLDVNGEPQTQRFIDIYEAWWKSIENENVQSKGIKNMLVKYVYFMFARTQSQNNTIQGNTQNESSINYFSKMNYATLVQKYNDAITTAWAIQQFIKSELSTYPEYNGDTLQAIS